MKTSFLRDNQQVVKFEDISYIHFENNSLVKTVKIKFFI